MLRGGVKFPTGGKAAAVPTSPQADKAEPVRFRRRRYSPDGRSKHEQHMFVLLPLFNTPETGVFLRPWH